MAATGVDADASYEVDVPMVGAGSADLTVGRTKGCSRGVR